MNADIAVDSSAFVAIVLGEAGAGEFVTRLGRAGKKWISVVSMVEAGIVLERKLGARGSRELDWMMRAYQLEVHPTDVEQGRAALLAYWRYGKGLHPAGLNFGDCFSYALAKVKGIPLLFKGDDFGRTDVPIFSE